MDRLKGIKAVLFDFDDTLGNREIYAYECYREFLQKHTTVDDPVEFEAMLQDVMLWDEKGNVSKKHVVNMMAEKYGIHVLYDEFIEWWNTNLWKYCVAFDDAEKTLEYLSDQYQLGIITNGPSEGQRLKVQHAGLERFFKPESMIVSGDYPYAKPDVRLFQKACERLGVQPEEAVYVGDIFANDVLGAYRAGMVPIWIWTAGERKKDADVYRIHTISELKEIL